MLVPEPLVQVMSEPFGASDLDPNYTGQDTKNLNDEIMLALIEGCADEIMLSSYTSLLGLSDHVVIKCYRMVLLTYGLVGPALSKRYGEVTS